MMRIKMLGNFQNPFLITGASIPPDHPLVTTTQDDMKQPTGKSWLANGTVPANEGFMRIGSGIATLSGFGPTGGNPHAPDEWVSIHSLPVTSAMFASIIHD
jgi:acetylornithine deacetylase/succinyl-diaminopimelate desuccinylase-like protein